MFRDAEEELQRLQEQLLDEDPSGSQEALLDDDSLDDLLSDEIQDEGPHIYQNYSNAYGKKLRNYASNYKAYNSDKTDTDLERFSQAVLEPKTHRRSGWIWLLCVLFAVTATVALLLLLKLKGGFL